ncbi:serine O-acetyltransferase [Microbacterium sp. MYb64]|uniref:serine O-acetyltransferase n=1 Tax=Microbacterium sp. MYb64 TaxID=1848691 RepID=UPI0015E30479|nr:hypothetical protein [Microbacterium sp. MYb64]
MTTPGIRRRLRDARRGLDDDARFLSELAGGQVARSPSLLQGLAHPSLRAGWLFRVASGGGAMGRVARNLLLSWHGCDVSPGARFLGALHLPHPHGVTIGIGVVIGDRVTIYQGVTLGANQAGRYPVIAEHVRIFPQSIVAGAVRVGAGATIGAQSFVSRDVPARAVTHRRAQPQNAVQPDNAVQPQNAVQPHEENR